MEKDFARGECAKPKARSRPHWSSPQVLNADMGAILPSKEENWLTVRREKLKEQPKTFRSLPPHLQSPEAIKEYVEKHIRGPQQVPEPKSVEAFRYLPPPDPTPREKAQLVAAANATPGMLSGSLEKSGERNGGAATKEPQKVALEGGVLGEHYRISVPLSEHYRKMSKEQFKREIERNQRQFQIQALQQMFGLDEQGAKIALRLRPKGVVDLSVMSFNNPKDNRTVNLKVFPADYAWYAQFKVNYDRARAQQARKRAQQQQAAQRQAAQQQAQRQQQQIIEQRQTDRLASDEHYQDWNAALSNTTQRRVALAALEQKIKGNKKPMPGGGTLEERINQRVEARVSELFRLTGRPVSAEVQRGIKNEVLFQALPEAQEIAYSGKMLTDKERSQLSSFYNNLKPDQRQTINDQTNATYLKDFNQSPDPNDRSWQIIRNSLLTQYYAGAGNPQQTAQQNKSLGKPTAANPEAENGFIPFDKTGVAIALPGNTNLYGIQQGSQVANNQQPGRALTPEEQYRARFQNEIVGNAQQLLQANRQRLANEQAKYSQNTNPNSPHWQQLWQMAGKRREFAQKERNLQAERDRISLERQHISAIPSLTDGMGATPEQIRNSPKHKQLVKLSEQQQKIEAQIEQAKQMQVSLEYAYPALAAINNETGTKPGDIQAVLQRMPGKFSDIRANIDKLSEQLQKDPGTATLFDSVVAAQLQQWQQDKSIPPEQRKQVMEWLKKERENKDRNAKIGAFASGGLFVASFIPQLRGISMGLRLAGIGVGGAVAASEIPDLIMLDAAAQAGRGGAGKLTSQSPDEARFNLVMGYANVALAGLDAGLEVGVVQKLAKSTMSVASSGAQITRQQWSQLIEFAKQGTSGGERARALLASIKNLPKQAADEILRAIDRVVPQPELAGVPKGDIDPKRPMQSTGTTQASGAVPQAIRSYKNAATVAPFIGKKFMPGLLPKGYKYAIIPLEDGTTRKVIYLPKSDKTMVPLKIDEATNTIQIGSQGEYRVVRDKYYNANLGVIGSMR
jgi:uncharacterized membrane protein